MGIEAALLPSALLPSLNLSVRRPCLDDGGVVAQRSVCVSMHTNSQVGVTLRGCAAQYHIRPAAVLIVIVARG